MTVTFSIVLKDDGSAERVLMTYTVLPPTSSRTRKSIFSKVYHIRWIQSQLEANSGHKYSCQIVLASLSRATFKRTEMREIPFTADGLSDLSVTIPVTLAGVFKFYVKCQESSLESTPKVGNLVIDPNLNYEDEKGEMTLPINGICALTIIPKWMPTINHWPQHFDQFSKTGYNMVHFAPVNKRGISNSPYSIYDQHAISDDLFDDVLPEEEKHSMLREMILKIRKDYRILCVTDVVWNHTSCDSDWLLDHPEAGYNLKTAPYLRAAYDLDEALMDFSRRFEVDPSLQLRDEADLNNVVERFRFEYFEKLALYEYEVLDIMKTLVAFEMAWKNRNLEKCLVKKYVEMSNLPRNELLVEFEKELIERLPEHSRFSKTLNISKAVDFMVAYSTKLGQISEEALVKELHSILNDLNLNYYHVYDQDKAIIFQQIRNRARYLRLEPHGPKLGQIGSKFPLVDTYFTRLPLVERTKKHHPDELVLANNGWIWNADPLVNFAGPTSKAYLRREVIAWGDCVKLRYGNGPEDNPWLWNFQKDYSIKMASLFYGFRIDNCHSTPMHVASYFLDEARKINPNLYVFAELFTGSEDTDISFVSELGINSLIREAMNAWDAAELSRIVHRQGGLPLGSFTFSASEFPTDVLGHYIGTAYEPIDHHYEVTAKSSVPHALFMDCTHDNETPHQKRTAPDTLANAALVAMAYSSIGSVKGYDEIVPELLNVVTETRKYQLSSMDDGIVSSKSILNQIHAKMAIDGYTEIHVNQEHDYISIHRFHPTTHEGYLLIARCAFRDQKSNYVHSPIRLKGQKVSLVQCATLYIGADHSVVPRHYTHKPGEPRTATDNLQPMTPVSAFHFFPVDDCQCEGEGCITGLPSTLKLDTNQSFLTREDIVGSIESGDIETVISLLSSDEFVPGSIVLYKTAVVESNLSSGLAFSKLKRKIGLTDPNLETEMRTRLGLDSMAAGSIWQGVCNPLWFPGLVSAVASLTITEINVILYRTAGEEIDTLGTSTYNIPGFGDLVYCGLQGIISVLIPLARNNDLGHPMCNNLRQGPWLCQYVYNRLALYAKYYPSLLPLQNWLREVLEEVSKLPSTFLPKYFAFVVLGVYYAVKYQALSLQSLPKVHETVTTFEYSCKITACQLVGSLKSTGLFPAPYPTDSQNQGNELQDPCLAAGLPHFSSGFMRCWGRDIFIALPGLLISTSQFEIARNHLISFGSTLRHGLIPNLLDNGRMPRYNARDAVWFWMCSIIEYCKRSPEGFDFLNTKVYRRFIPVKDRENNILKDGDTFISWDDPRIYKYDSTIAELMHEVLCRHREGIEFREWNAGPNLDHAMSSKGFDIKISTDANTGFVRGGNEFNCGTWMDKMGDYEFAGTKGIPATPRDGAAIEIVGMTKRVLGFVQSLINAKDSRWKWSGTPLISYTAWDAQIQSNFEKCFFIPSNSSEDVKYVIEYPKLINQRGIYKDTVGSSARYTDYQLRPNICIAMVNAPELFDPAHARSCLLIMKDKLAGPLGIKTLDPSDWKYRGDYDNSNASNDPTVAHGFNYHQGPEWVWVYGYFLRAYLYFFTKAPGVEASKIQKHRHEVLSLMKRPMEYLQSLEENPYAGLPELTNQNGKYCKDSCHTQAWSTSVFMELVMDLK